MNKLIRLLAIVSICSAGLSAATRYAVTGGDGLWGSTNNWSTTSGGGSGSSAPTSADDVHFDANSPSITVNTTGRSTLSLDFTGYTNTLTMSQTVGVNGAWTLAATANFAGSSSFIVAATITITSNAKVLNVPVTLQGNNTITLADDFNVSGLCILGSTTAATVLTGNHLICSGGLRYAGTSGSVSGTTEIKLTGTGTVDAPSITSGRMLNKLTIAAGGGTITTSGVINFDLGQIKYLSGTVVTSNGTWTTGGATTQKGYATIQ